MVAPARPDILFIEEDASARAKKFCLKCGGEMRPEARKCRHCGAWVEDQARRVIESERVQRLPAPPPRSFVLPAFVSFISFFCFWIPGAVLTWYFLEEARRIRKLSGRSPRGMWALQAMMSVFVYLPFFAVVTLTVLGLLWRLLFAFAAHA